MRLYLRTIIVSMLVLSSTLSFGMKKSTIKNVLPSPSHLKSPTDIMNALADPEVSPQRLREMLQNKAHTEHTTVRELVNKQCFFLRPEDQNDRIFSHCRQIKSAMRCFLLHYAIQAGSAEKLQVLLEAKPNLEVTEDLGLTPLLMAIVHKKVAHVRYLVEAGASLFAVERTTRLTAVGLAIECGSPENDYLQPIIKELLASPQAFTSDSNHCVPKISTTHYAQVKNYVQLLKYFAADLPPQCETSSSQEPNFLITSYLSETETIPLFTLAELGQFALIKNEYEDYPLATRLFNAEGDYALHIALKEAIAAKKIWGENIPTRFIETIKVLLLCDRETINYRTGKGHTPLHLAVQNKDFPLIELFIRAGADPDAPLIIKKEGKEDVTIAISPRALAHKGGFGQAFEELVNVDSVACDMVNFVLINCALTTAEEQRERQQLSNLFEEEFAQVVVEESRQEQLRQEQRARDGELKLAVLPDDEAKKCEKIKGDEITALARIHSLYKNAGERLQLDSAEKIERSSLRSVETDTLHNLKQQEQAAKRKIAAMQQSIRDLSAIQGNLRKNLLQSETEERALLSTHFARLAMENAESNARTQTEKEQKNAHKKVTTKITGERLKFVEAVESQGRRGIEAAQDGESLQALTPLALAICLRNFPMVHFFLSQGHNAREASPSLDSSAPRSPFDIAKSYQESEAPGESASSNIFNLIFQHVGRRHNPYSL